VGGGRKAREEGADRFRSDRRLGFATIAAALCSHRRRKTKVLHLLADSTKLPDCSVLSPRGPRGSALMPWGRRRACHLCLGFPTRMRRFDAMIRLGWGRRRGSPRSRSRPCARDPGSRHGRTQPPTSTAPAVHARPQVPAGRHFPSAQGGEGGTRTLAGAVARRIPPGTALRATVPSAEPASHAPTRESTGPKNPPAWPVSDWPSRRGKHDSWTHTAPNTHRLLPLRPLSPACTVSERSCPGAAVLGNSFNFLALRFKPPELAASSSARSRPRFKGRLKPPLPAPPPPPAPPLAPVPPWCWWWWW
jgi:hypothetical protein